MTTKADVKRLLGKGLTGKEAGRLILLDNLQVDRGKEGILSERDIAALKNGLRTQQDIRDYNSYVDLYRLVDYSLKDANIYRLEAESYLMLSRILLEEHIDKASSNRIMMSTPAIVTQKQYEELKQKQREMLLREPHKVGDVILERAEIEPDEEVYLPDNPPKRWKPAISEILELIRAGKLNPLLIRDDKQFYDYENYYKGAREYEPAKDVEELLTGLLDNKLSKQERDELMEHRAILGKELYEAGLPEWIKWIDEYHPGLEEGTGARPEGMMQSFDVAIIQNPDSSDVDEKGYWIERDLLGSKREVDSEQIAKGVRQFVNSSILRIKNFLGIQAVVEVISKAVDVPFSEDFDFWYSSLESIVDLYNSALDTLQGLWVELEDIGLEGLKPIKLGRVKPTAASIKHYRDRMAIALGENWWREAVESLEYEELEPDSLAEEIAGEITRELKKRAKGGKNG